MYAVALRATINIDCYDSVTFSPVFTNNTLTIHTNAQDDIKRNL